MINNKIKISNKNEISKIKKKLKNSFDEKKCYLFQIGKPDIYYYISFLESR